MSDFDEKDIIETTSADFDPADVVSSDFDEADVIESTPKKKAKPSISEAALKGVQQGVTWGTGDEIVGGIESGLDLAQSFLAKLGIMDPSPTDVNKKLASEGVKGDVGPKSTVEAYRAARDVNRKENKEAMDAHPVAYTAGGVAGGALTIPFTPGAIAAPFGQAAAGAGVLTKAALAARNAIPAAALGSAALSDADLTKGEVGKFAADTVEGTAIGTVAAPALVIGAAGVGKVGDAAKFVGGKLVPERAKLAYQRGLEGVKTYTDDFYTKTTNENNALSNEVSLPIVNKGKVQLNAYNDNISELEKQIAALELQQKNAIELGLKKQSAQNAVDVEQVNKQVIETAKETQKHLGNVKKTLGSAFDQIDKDASSTGVIPDTKEIIDQFQDNLWHNANLPDSDVNAIMKRILPSVGQKDLNSFQAMKRTLAGYFENSNPGIRKAAKQAYSQLKAKYADDLQAAGYDELSARMADTNRKWGALAELQENFVDNINPNRITKEIEVSPDTINAITNFGEQNPKQIAKSDFMTNLIKVADPENSQSLIGKIAGTADDVVAAKNPVTDVEILPDPRIAKFQELLKAAGSAKDPLTGKPVNPSKVGDMVGLSSDPSTLKPQLLRLLPKYGMKTGDDVGEQSLNSMLSFLEKEMGPEYVNKLKPRLQENAKNVFLRDGKEIDDSIRPSTLGLLSKAASGGASDVANFAGLTKRAVTGAVKTPASAVVPNKIKDVSKIGVKRLSDATPEQIKKLGQWFAQRGGENYARVLENAQGRNNVSRNAIMFGLMQQPEFREQLQEYIKQEDGQDEQQ